MLMVDRLATAIALCLLLTLGACASRAPTYERPAPPIDANYPAELQLTDEGITQRARGWQQTFTDPLLQRLIVQALANNRDLRVATLRVEQARSVYGIQRAERLPGIGIGAGEMRSRTPADLSLTRQPLIASAYQAGLVMSSWEIDFWGRIRSLQDAALHTYLATDAARRAVVLGLIAQVANSYLGLRELDERMVLADATIATRETSARIFRRRVEVGSTSRLDLTEVETLLQQATILKAQLAQLRAVQRQALVLLVGAPINLTAEPGQLDDGAVLRDVRVGLPSDLLTERPDIVAAEQQLMAANARIGAARAAFFPRITLTAALGTASAELDGLFGSGSSSWSHAIDLALPIFDASRNRNNLALTQAREQEAVAQYEAAIQRAFRDVANALAARLWLTEQVHTLQRTVALQTERARLATLRYDNGSTAFLQVLDAQRELLATSQQLVQARRALLSSRVDLYVALGGGPQGPADNNLDGYKELIN